jgi:GR25 family glycosyltransferase involved in LPS biosynthesis
MYSVQIIFIVGSEERKASQIKQLKELQIPFAVFFLDASMPENTQSYLPLTKSDYEKRHICISRSHVRAIEHASLDTSPDISIIMEDDAAFHKDFFVEGVKEILEQWDTLLLRDEHMLSIGWVPMNKFEKYEEMDLPVALTSIPGSKFLPFHTWGLQAYMIKRQAAKVFTPIIKHDTHEQFITAICAYKPDIIKEEDCDVVDHWVNKLLGQVPLFPILVIEQKNTKSMVGTDVKFELHPWDNLFINYSEKQLRYWSF